MSTRKIAFVIPRYEPRSAGGAEVLAQQVAEHLVAAGNEVTAFTTCARDHFTWMNHYPPGISNVNGVQVHRFPVDDRSPDDGFAALQQRITRGEELSHDEEEAWIRGSVHSSALYDHLRRNRAAYDLIILIPYLFGTTRAAGAVAPEKSVIIPCLHDEPYARLSIFKEMMTKARGLIFNSEPERELARRLYDIPGEKTAVAGMGVPPRERYRPERFRKKHRLTMPFIIYAGRREQGKNTPLLMEYMRLFNRQYPGRLKLVLIGTGEVAIDAELRGVVLDPGYVSEEMKHNGYAAALALCQPSVNESFSIVLMEAWLAGTPALVHGDCAVTTHHCLCSNGGLPFRDYCHFEEALLLLLEHPGLRDRLAAGGRRYVLREYSWEAVMKRYGEAFEQFGF